MYEFQTCRFKVQITWVILDRKKMSVINRTPLIRFHQEVSRDYSRVFINHQPIYPRDKLGLESAAVLNISLPIQIVSH